MNEISEAGARARAGRNDTVICRMESGYLRDMAHIGDALLEVTGAFRINYEILGNTVPELHAHIIPRYAHEPEERRRGPAWFYDWENAKKYSAAEHGELFQRLRRALQPGA